jgi:hypothetical protein
MVERTTCTISRIPIFGCAVGEQEENPARDIAQAVNPDD